MNNRISAATTSITAASARPQDTTWGAPAPKHIGTKKMTTQPTAPPVAATLAFDASARSGAARTRRNPASISMRPMRKSRMYGLASGL
jgi:hypothetical protein